MGVWVALSCGSAPIGQVYWFRNRLYVTFCLEYPLSYLDSVSSTPHLHRCVVWAWCFNFLTIKVLFPRWASLPLPAADWWGPSSPRFTAGAGLPTRSLWPQTLNLMGHQFWTIKARIWIVRTREPCGLSFRSAPRVEFRLFKALGHFPRVFEYGSNLYYYYY